MTRLPAGRAAEAPARARALREGERKSVAHEEVGSDDQKQTAVLRRSLRRRRLLGPLGMAALSCSTWCYLGCQHEPSRSPPMTAPPALPEQSSAPQETTGTLERPEGKLVLFERELERVENLRGLSSRQAVDGMELSREQLLRHVQNALRYERPPEVMQGSELMLVGLGLVHADFDFEATMLDLLGENLAGLYEPRLNLMLIREDLPEALRVITLRHELVHALQDQHYDLTEIVRATPDDTDRSSALSCLAEGDATSAMLDGILPGGQSALDVPETEIVAQFFAQPPATSTPPIIVSSLYAPYVDGLLFVHRLRRRGGFAEVDRVWARPPVSTEQILHLDKYDAAEAPVEVAVLPPPSDDAETILHDIWGEQSLGLALAEWSGLSRLDRAVSEAAAGWGGDRIVAYRLQGAVAVAWDLVMDTEEDARELIAFLEEAGRSPEPESVTPELEESAGSEAQEAAAADAESGVKTKSGASLRFQCLVLGERKTLGVVQVGERVVLLSGPATRQQPGSCAAAQAWWAQARSP